MTSCTPDQIVESSTFLATSKSIELLLSSLPVRSVVDGSYYYVMDNGEKKLLLATVFGEDRGSFIRLSGRVSHLTMTFVEFKLLLKSNTLTLVARLLRRGQIALPWGNSGTLTKLQSTLSKLAVEA